jgi:hypothetical protein
VLKQNDLDYHQRHDVNKNDWNVGFGFVWIWFGCVYPGLAGFSGSLGLFLGEVLM